MNPIEADLSPLALSLRSASLAVAIVAPLGVMAAERVRRLRGPGRTAADLLLLSPLVLPPTVLGFVLLQLLGREAPLGALLARFGVPIVFSWQATVLSAAVVAFPLMYRASLGALESIDGSLADVARSLGAGEGRVWRRITLPLALPGLVAGLSLSFARALGEFGTTLLLAGNIPGRTQTLPLAIYAAVDGGESGRAWRLTALVLLLNGLALGLLQALEARAGRSRGRSRTGPAEAGAAHVPPARVPVPGRPARPFQLEVAIGRELPGFRLEVAFSSDCRRLGLLGASGAGKSQLLRCLAGLERPDGGRIELNGRVLFDGGRGIDVPLRQRRIALVLQHYALFPHRTVAQNVGFGLADLPAAERGRRVAGLLERVGLLQKANRYPGELSGGEQQRIALVRALAIEPELLLLDEPFSAQDAHLRRQLQQQLSDLLESSGVPALLVTHDLEEAYRLSEELLVIERGRILVRGPKRQVFDQPGELAVARLSGCKNLSRVRRLSDRRLWAIDWGRELALAEPAAAEITHVGIRAHHLRLSPAGGEKESETNEANHWSCRLVQASEGPFQVSVYVVPADPAGAEAQPLQVELPRAEWLELRRHRQPWRLTLPGPSLLLLRQGGSALPRPEKDAH